MARTCGDLSVAASCCLALSAITEHRGTCEAKQYFQMKQMIMNHMAVICVATAALTLPLLLVGCDRQVSHTESSSVNSDGTVKSKEKTVTQSQDGTVTKTEESKTTTSTNKP